MYLVYSNDDVYVYGSAYLYMRMQKAEQEEKKKKVEAVKKRVKYHMSIYRHWCVRVYVFWQVCMLLYLSVSNELEECEGVLWR